MPKGESLSQIKLRAQAREQEERQKAEIRHTVLVLALDHFSRHRYHQTLSTLEMESGVSLNKYAAADNMDLPYILQEFSEFYNMKYGRKPKLVRKLTQSDADALKHSRAENRKAQRFPSIRKEGTKGSNKPSGDLPNPGYGGVDSGLPEGMTAHSKYMQGKSSSSKERRRSSRSSDQSVRNDGTSSEPGDVGGDNSNLPPRSTPRSKTQKSRRRDDKDREKKGSGNGDMGDIGGMGISGSTCTKEADQKGDKKGQKGGGHSNTLVSAALTSEYAGKVEGENAIQGWFEHRLLKPLPDFGNKALSELAAVIQSEIHVRSPNVRWSDIAELEEAKELLKEAVVMPIKYPQFFTGLLQPWKGVLLYGPPGTGKTMLARAVATECQTTFFNISASSIVSKYRGESEKLVRCLYDLARYHAPSTIFIDEIDSIMAQRSTGDHEGSRRLKTELLIQMDGLNKTDDLVFVLAASNLPWLLDQAILRRLEKRIWIPLPNVKGRKIMIEKHMSPDRAEGIDHQKIAEMTKGYSGSDIFLLCKEAAMRPMRRVMKDLKKFDDENPGEEATGIEMEKCTMRDMEAALQMVKSSSSNQKWLDEYTKFTQNYGAGFSAEDDKKGDSAPEEA